MSDTGRGEHRAEVYYAEQESSTRKYGEQIFKERTDLAELHWSHEHREEIQSQYKKSKSSRRGSILARLFKKSRFCWFSSGLRTWKTQT